MRESQALYGRHSTVRPARGHNALGATDSIGSYVLDAQLRRGYRQSVRRRKLRSFISGVAEGVALVALLGLPIAAWMWGVAHG